METAGAAAENGATFEVEVAEAAAAEYDATLEVEADEKGAMCEG